MEILFLGFPSHSVFYHPRISCHEEFNNGGELVNCNIAAVYSVNTNWYLSFRVCAQCEQGHTHNHKQNITELN